MPGLNWGAQEMPGLRDLPRRVPAPRRGARATLRLLRASVIAHEMSHMWFGDLVTMTWWEDTWLQESFADYMGYRVAADAAGFAGALLGHEVGPQARGVRRRRAPLDPPGRARPRGRARTSTPRPRSSTSISYAKGNSVLRQLATWLGDETFLRGVNTYLTRHRFGNATLADFVAALDEASDRDVRAWVDAWLRSTGFDTLRVERDGDGPGAAPRRRRARTGCGSRRTTTPGRWSAASSWTSRTSRCRCRRTPGRSSCRTLAARRSPGSCSTTVVGRPWTAGLCRIDDDLVRAVLWTMLFDRVQTARSTPIAFGDLVERHLPGERSAMLVTAVLDRTLTRVLPLRSPAARSPLLLELARRACATGLLHARLTGARTGLRHRRRGRLA